MNFLEEQLKDSFRASPLSVASRVHGARTITPALAAVATALAISVVFFWAFANGTQQLHWRALFVMKFNTALSIIFAGCALYGSWINTRRSTILAFGCAAIVVVLSLLTLSEYLFHLSVGIDELFVRDVAPIRFPGRSSPVTATASGLVGIALIVATAGWYSASQLIFFLAVAAPISSLGGYLYAAPGLSAETTVPIVSLHTAFCQFILCIGGLFLRSDRGFVRVIVSTSRAGSIARMLMPVGTVVPLITGLLIVAAEQSNLMSVQFGTALLVSCCVLCFSGSVWITSSLLWTTEKSQASAEDALGRTRNRLNAAMIANEVGTWEWNVRENRVYADTNLAAMFRVSKADANGGPLESYEKAINSDDLQLVRDSIAKALRNGESYSSEYRLIRSDGRDRWVLSRGRVRRDASGQAQTLSGVLLDVTEQRTAVLELKKSEERRSLALESAELGTWTIDPATMVLTTDKRFREIFGFTIEEVTHVQAMSAIHPDDREKVEKAVTEASRQSDPSPYAVEYRIVLPDGSVHWVFAKGRLNSAGSGPSSFDGTVADITERKIAEHEREQLHQSERTARTEAERAGRMKDEFLATLSHEIRTPLNAILGWAQILKRSKNSDDLDTGLDTIVRNARSQAQIIEDLLDMSRIISGKVRLDVQRLDLAAIVESAIKTQRPTAEAKAIKLTSVIDPLSGVAVSGDASRLQQVLWNLISNALKFTPKDGRVQILLERVNSHLEVSVIDSGEGIDPDFLPYVFDRFRQADASTTRRHGGLGLGLSIVKQLVELHGGSVRVKSAGRGHGTTFIVALPLIVIHRKNDEDEVHRRHPTVSTPLDSSLDACSEIQGLRILLVDDEPDARVLVKRILEDCEAIVTTAASADEAIAQLTVSRFDVLVSDIGMPSQDGYSLIKRVRALGQENGSEMPAIALTAYARAEDRIRAVSAGFLMHVAKPVEPAELITMVAGAAGRNRGQ